MIWFDFLVNNDVDRCSIEHCVMSNVFQCLSKKFYQWKCRIASLSERRASIPPLQCNAEKLLNQSLNLKALCSLETTDVRVALRDFDLSSCLNRIKKTWKYGSTVLDWGSYNKLLTINPVSNTQKRLNTTCENIPLLRRSLICGIACLRVLLKVHLLIVVREILM